MRDRDAALGHPLGDACRESALRLEALFADGAGARHTGSEVQDDYTLLYDRGTASPLRAWTFGPYAARSALVGAIFLVPDPRIIIGLDRTFARACIAVRTSERGVWFPTSRNGTGFSVLGGDLPADVTGEDGPWRAFALAGLADLGACADMHEQAVDDARAAARAQAAREADDTEAERRAALDAARRSFAGS